jgi:copper chaperone CopZ
MEISLSVPAMMCDGCAESVTDALMTKCKAVQTVTVDLVWTQADIAIARHVLDTHSFD